MAWLRNTRRGFINHLSALLAGLGIPGHARTTVDPKVLNLIRCLDVDSSLTNLCLSTIGTNVAPQNVINDIEVRTGLDLSSAPEREIRIAIRRCQEDDFRHHRTVNIEGWVLSRTEVDLIALPGRVHSML